MFRRRHDAFDPLRSEPFRIDRRGVGRPAVLLCVAAALVSVPGFYLGTRLSQPGRLLSMAPNTGPLRVDARRLEFGEVFARSDFKLRIPVANISDRDVEITGWDRSCGSCTSVEPQTLVIPAGETRDVTVTLDLTPSRPAGDLKTIREFDRSAIPHVRYVASGDAYRGPPMEWALTGRVQDFVAADPQVVVCKAESIRSPLFAPFSINLEYGVDVESVIAECGGGAALASVTATRIDSRHWRLDVAPAAEAEPPLGEFRFGVNVRHTAEAGESLPPIVIPVSGSRVPDVVAEVLPSPVLGTHAVGTSLPVVVRLRSRTGSRFEAEPVDLGSASLGVESIDRQPEHIEFRLTKMVEQQGLEKLQLQYAIRHEDGLVEESTARVFCVGVVRNSADPQNDLCGAPAGSDRRTVTGDDFTTQQRTWLNG